MTTATDIVDPIEVASAPVESAVPANDAEDDAAMMAGFAAESGESSDAPTTLPATETTPPTSEATPDAGTPPPAEPRFVQITDEQLTNLLNGMTEIATIKSNVKKLADDMGGRVGSVEAWVKNLRASTPSGQAVQVTAEDFAELRQEFPELTDLQVKGINRALSKMTGTAQVVSHDTTQFKQELKADLAAETLDETHPDWRTVIGLPERTGGPAPDTAYRRWLATQPPAYQAKLASTWNATVIASSIDQFTKATGTQPKSPAKAGDARRTQLAAAVVPQGAGTVPTNTARSEDDEIMEGFKQERGR